MGGGAASWTRIVLLVLLVQGTHLLHKAETGGGISLENQNAPTEKYDIIIIIRKFAICKSVILTDPTFSSWLVHTEAERWISEHHPERRRPTRAHALNHYPSPREGFQCDIVSAIPK